jgi:hypothetical protein
MICTPHPYIIQVFKSKNEMIGTCRPNMYGGEVRTRIG